MIPRLVLIAERPTPALARALEAGRGIAVQLRRPGAPARALLEDARALAETCASTGAALFINGRLDVALAVGAHLHLPAAGMTVAEARPHLGARMISTAVHDEAEAREASGADFALVSPVHRPSSKPNDTRAPLGPAGYARLAAELACPALALGGMTADRTRELRPPGLAVASGVLDAADPRAAAEALLRALLE